MALMESDMEQFGIGEKHGMLRKLIKELSVGTLYEAVENKITHTPQFW